MNLNPAAEQLRRQYLEILESERAQVRAAETQGNEQEDGKTADTTVPADQKFSPGNPLNEVCKLDGGDSKFWADNGAASQVNYLKCFLVLERLYSPALVDNQSELIKRVEPAVAHHITSGIYFGNNFLSLRCLQRMSADFRA